MASVHHGEALNGDFTLCLGPERFRLCHHSACASHRGTHCLPLIGLIALLIWTALELFSNENRPVLMWHQELTCLLAFGAVWRGKSLCASLQVPGLAELFMCNHQPTARRLQAGYGGR